MNPDIVIKFTKCEHELQTPPVWQFDRGRRLIIQGTGITIPTAVHFQTPIYSDPVDRMGTIDEETGALIVGIPDVLLWEETGNSYDITAYVYCEDEDHAQTEYRIVIPVRHRTRPGEDVPDPEQRSIITDLIDVLTQNASGLFTLEVDENGNLWAIYPGQDAPNFEYDSETGALYFLFDDSTTEETSGGN